MLRKLLRVLFPPSGYNISRYGPALGADDVRQAWLLSHDVTTVIDIGANNGQYGRELRKFGYRGRIVSYEPLRDAFTTLKVSADADGQWSAHNLALGPQTGSAEINVAANSWSSSLLAMLPKHLAAAPESAYVGTEWVAVSTLDEECAVLGIDSTKAFLKIDAQGYTVPILDGGQQTLQGLRGLQVEMSLVSLYEGEILIEDIIARLRGAGLVPVMIKPEFTDRESGQQLQVDGIFVRL